jgi:hypothetical protein
LDALLAQLAWSAVDFARGTPTPLQFATTLTSLREHYARASKLDALTLAGDATLELNSMARSLSRNIVFGEGRVLFDELTPTEQEAVQRRMASRAVPTPQQAIDEGKFLEHSPHTVLLRFFEMHADLFLDGKYWEAPFASLDYGNTAATEAARRDIVRYYSSLIADAIWLVEQDPTDLAEANRSRLLRAALALDLLAPAPALAAV